MAFQTVFALVLAFAGALLGRAALGRARLARRVLDAPLVPIAELRGGVAGIRGRIDDRDDRLESPLTHRGCVYFRLEVKEQRLRWRRTQRGFEPDSTWYPVVTDERYARCSVSDETGAIGIDLKQAEKRVRPSATLHIDALHPPPLWLETFLEARYGYSLRGFFLPKSVRISEQALFVGEEVFALGEAMGGPERRLVGGQAPLLVSDRDARGLARDLRLEGAAFAAFAVLAVLLAGWIASR